MARSSAPAVRSVRSPEAIVALRKWLQGVDETTRTRGEAYYARLAVQQVWTHADHFFEAVVQGQEPYNVSLFYTRGRWSSQCSCPVRINCKHAYAAALAWIVDVEVGGTTPAPAAPSSGAPAPAAAAALPGPARPAAPVKKPFREEWEPHLAAKLGRALFPDERRRLDDLQALHAEFVRAHGLLYPGTLERHGFAYDPPPGASLYQPCYDDWWDRAQPPADPWALWQFIAYDYERTGRPIPEVFRPLTDTRAAEAAIRARLVQKELAHWRRALATIDELEADERPNPVAAIAGLRARLREDGGLYLEVRPGVGKLWREPTQKFLRDLADARPADFEHLTPAETALGLAVAAELRPPADVPPRGALPEAVATAALRTLAARPAVFLADESPFAIEPAPLVPEAIVSTAGATHLELRLSTADGRDASAAKPVVLRPEPLYAFAGRIWRGPPPVPSRQLPTVALDDPKIMARLRKAGLRLPRSLELKVRPVTLRPLLRCWIADTDRDYGSGTFQAQLVAVGDNPPCTQHWSGVGGWQWIKGGAPPPRAAGEPLYEFDLGVAPLAAARFADFRLSWSTFTDTWSRPVGKAFPDDFVAWHATLPPDLPIDATPEIASLFGPALKAHLEFTAAPGEGAQRDWFDLTVALRVEDTKLTGDEIALLLKARGKWVSLPRLGWRRLELTGGPEGDAVASTLDRLGLGATDVLATGRATTHRLHALQLAAETAALEARDTKLAAALRERVAALAAEPPPPLPAGLKAVLRPYQVEGYHFLAHLASLGFGGVLADDMGLGKTVQTLAWLLHLEETRAAAPDAAPLRVLVVCPKSVTHGWLVETARFAPSLHAAAFDPLVHGLVSGSASGAQPSAPSSQLLVANYVQLRLNAEWFRERQWDAVVLDEGQFIKNPSSQVAVAARALLCRHRVVLTGTPVENRLTDLWSLFAFAQPGLLGGQTAFRRLYDHNDPAALGRLHRRVRHFLLRRTKAQAAPELPPRTEDEIVVELEGDQRTLYDAELKRARAQLLGVSTDRALDAVRFNVLASLLRLRQICCHPGLIDPVHRKLPSAKLEALLERLEELQEEGHQVLVFSQFVEMLHLIRERLDAARIGHLMLTGSTENRAELVDEFQRDKSKTVFLLSLKAAGFGLNLTAASYAILYDPWWNPAVEAQAIDRTHRIGQTQPVVAYRLLAEGTVEEKIRALQKEKAALAGAVVQEESLAAVLDLESLRRILD
jgi:hypothetical protein